MTTYKVDGMDCQGCVNALSKAIANEMPQAKFQIDLAGGLVTVEGAGDETRIAAAVDKAGFTYQGVAAK